MSKSVRSVILQIVVVAVLAGGGYGLWSHRDGLPLIGNAATPDGGGKPQRPPTPVDVAVARAGTITLTLEAVGTAQANEAVILSSEVAAVHPNISNSALGISGNKRGRDPYSTAEAGLFHWSR